MSFINLKNKFLWTTCFVVLMAVPAAVWADKNKDTKSPPPKQAPAQKPAPNVNKPPAAKPNPNAPGKPNPNAGAKPNPNAAGKPNPNAAGKPNPNAAGKPNPNLGGKAIQPPPRVVQRTVRDVAGHKVAYDRSGRVRTIQTRGGATVYRGAHGSLRAEHNLPGGRRVVFAGRNYGYMERNYARGYRMRTYYEHGRFRAVLYRSYMWRGRPYYVYAPYYYYRPVFYGWAYNPWVAPVYYQWGWAGNPWYGYYGYYFAPAPFYPGADLWLTDMILAENLKMAYDAQQSSGRGENLSASGTAPTNPNDAQLSPEVKQMNAEEVKEQLAAEKAAAARPPAGGPEPTSNDPPSALDPNHTVFVVASNLDVATSAGDCELTPGDVLNRIDDTPDSDDMVAVRVASSKQGDCARGSKPAVKVADLQDMSNRFREQLDAGLQQLAANSGKNGLPVAPDTGTSAVPDVPEPVADQDVKDQLAKLQTEAEQAEQDVKRGSSSGQVGGE